MKFNLVTDAPSALTKEMLKPLGYDLENYSILRKRRNAIIEVVSFDSFLDAVLEWNLKNNHSVLMVLDRTSVQINEDMKSFYKRFINNPRTALFSGECRRGDEMYKIYEYDFSIVEYVLKAGSYNAVGFIIPDPGFSFFNRDTELRRS